MAVWCVAVAHWVVQTAAQQAHPAAALAGGTSKPAGLHSPHSRARFACSAAQARAARTRTQALFRMLPTLQFGLAQCWAAAGAASLLARQQPLPRVAAAAAGSALLHWQEQQPVRCKHSVRMVLLEDHPQLGQRGDIVSVKAGHARYMLFPRGQADYAIPSVLADLRKRGLLSASALEQLQHGSTQRPTAAAAVDPSSLPAEQQLPQIAQLLSSKHVVVSRRFSRTRPEQPMVGEVTARQLAAYVAQQLKVLLPPELILMHKRAPISDFGSFKVPLNLQDEHGRQVELGVLVQQTRRAPCVRAHLEQLRQATAAGAAARAG